ncbi:MAG: TerB family tellurite resistance protein [Myxococcales bacterium]|jgi:uncharacterized tellurite resistance protein B-like protein|nr:TerB family tellurite resistance protein [Myxococcales bacterium]
MKQHIDTITQLLLGAAYADKRLEGVEVTRIRTILQQILGGAALEPRVEEALAGFNPAGFNVHAAAASLKVLDSRDKRTLLELIASVNEADDELDLAEDTYLRNVALGFGVPESEFKDLALEVLAEDELLGLLN